VKAYQTFLKSLANPQTKVKYDVELKCFLKYLSIDNADKLITPKLIDSPKAIRQAEDNIIEYLEHLAKVEKLAPASINVRLAAITYFYSINRITLNRKYLGRFKPSKKKVRKGDLSYTHDQIATLIGNANRRDKMILLLLASTGMRIGALNELSINSLHKIGIEGYPYHIYKIIVYEGESEEYYTFTTFECARAIDDYLTERRHFGEQLKAEAPLIRADFNHSLKHRVQRPEALTTVGIQRLLDRLLIGSRLRVYHKKGTRELHTTMKSHGFRKHAITQMIKAKMDYTSREFIVGHKVSRGLDVSYDRTSEQDRLSEYLKAMDLLTISPENRLRQELADSRKTINQRLADKDRTIKKLSNKIADIEHNQKILMDLMKDPEQLRKKLEES
jgi:integrase